MQSVIFRHVLFFTVSFFRGVFAGENAHAQYPCYKYHDSIDPTSMQKGTISLSDSLLDVFANIRKDYRIIGYSKPDICSKRQIIFAGFTKDVEKNPYSCTFGAYYPTSGETYTEIDIKYSGKTKYFIKTIVFVKGRKSGELFFERRWVKFTK